MFGLIVMGYLLPICFYFLAHKIRSKTCLAIYSIFWLTVVGFAVYDLMVATNSTNEDADLSLGWVLVAGFIYFSCYMAIIGIISRIIVLYFRHQGKKIRISEVHLVSFCSVFILPQLIQIFVFCTLFIIKIPSLLLKYIANVIEIITSLLYG